MGQGFERDGRHAKVIYGTEKASVGSHERSARTLGKSEVEAVIYGMPQFQGQSECAALQLVVGIHDGDRRGLKKFEKFDGIGRRDRLARRHASQTVGGLASQEGRGHEGGAMEGQGGVAAVLLDQPFQRDGCVDDVSWVGIDWAHPSQGAAR